MSSKQSRKRNRRSTMCRICRKRMPAWRMGAHFRKYHTEQ